MTISSPLLVIKRKRNVVDEKYINELIYFENTLREIDNELSEGLGGLNSNLNVGESKVEVVGSLSSTSL